VRRLLLIPIFVIGLAAGEAGAAGFQSLGQNASRLGNAYAGAAAAAEDASSGACRTAPASVEFQHSQRL